MAKFEGTIEEFTRFIGGYARNKVNYITRSYRKKNGKCEICHSRTSKLEAAHLTGRERPVIISEILSNYIKDGIIKIDLQEFEDQFMESHMPIDSVIKILCKDCHDQYDRENKVLVKDLNDDEKFDEKLEQEESEIIKMYINSKMNKGVALELASKSLSFEINSRNSVYSNLNSAKDVWWLEPSPEKFKGDLNIILNRPKDKKLLVFKIPAKTIINPENVFDQRRDKEASKIIIPLSDSQYIDQRDFNFTPYLIKEVSY